MDKSDFPQGKFMSSVKIGAKGQIVIPKEVRDMFDIKTGETLLLLADIDKGIAIQRYNVLNDIIDATIDATVARRVMSEEGGKNK